MWSNPQFPAADLVTFTEEVLNGKLHFLCSEASSCWVKFFLAVILIVNVGPQYLFSNFQLHTLYQSQTIQTKLTLREKCPNTEFFLVHIFLYSDGIRRFTVNLRIQFEHREIRTRKNSVFEHFSRSVKLIIKIDQLLWRSITNHSNSCKIIELQNLVIWCNYKQFTW